MPESSEFWKPLISRPDALTPGLLKALWRARSKLKHY